MTRLDKRLENKAAALNFKANSSNEEVSFMKTFEYVCFSCGRIFRTGSSVFDESKGYECPKCKSANVRKIDISTLSGISSGGG